MNYLKPIELTHLTINPQLFPSENILQSQAGVGIYDGKTKDHRYQDGTLYLTSHRLIYIDAVNPHHQSCFLDMSLIRQTEYWVGFLMSSPKITLLLGPPPHSSSGSQPSQPITSLDHQLHPTPDHILNHPATSHWACHVCGFSNPPEPKCGLCGVPRHLSSTTPPFSNSRPRPPSSSRAPTGLKSSSLQTTSPFDQRTSSSDSQLEPFLSSSPNNAGVPSNQPTTTKDISCPSCTFLNHPSMVRCEMCDSILATVQLDNPTSNNSLDNPHTSDNENQIELQHSRAATPAPPSSFPSGSYIRLSFRKGGEKSFYGNLKKTLQNKTWKVGQVKLQDTQPSHHVTTKSSSLLDDSRSQSPLWEDDDHSVDHQSNPPNPIGINRILKNMDSQHQAHQVELTESLQDLRALMAKAKEMVQMAQSINARVSNLESSTSSNSTIKKMAHVDDDDAELTDKKKAGLIRSSLVKLGLPAPAVTLDMVDSDQDFAKELAKELGGLLNRKMDHQLDLTSSSGIVNHSSAAVGIWPLDEIWCIWNRARGISLVSPGEMISACQHLPEYTRPKIQLRTFKSGIRVLHTAYFSLEELESRLIKRLTNQANEPDPRGKEQEAALVIESMNDSEVAETLNRWGSLNKLSTLEIAQLEKLSVNLTNELLHSIQLGTTSSPINQSSDLSSPITNDSARSYPSIVRDFNPSTGETYWFLNFISDFIWTDPNL